MFLKTLAQSALLLCLAIPAAAGDAIKVVDPYARTSSAMANSGAAFMVIENHSHDPDRLIAARSDVAARVELHTHKADANGVMRMVEVEEGFVIPPHGSYTLERGGDHVMFLGLNRSLSDGDTVSVTLTFEKAGDVEIAVPVDLQRKPGGEAPMTHGHGHGHGHQHGTTMPKATN